MSNLASTLCFLALPTEAVGNSTLKGAPINVQFMSVSITYRITGLLETYRCYGSLCLEALSTQSLGYTTLMGALP